MSKEREGARGSSRAIVNELINAKYNHGIQAHNWLLLLGSNQSALGGCRERTPLGVRAGPPYLITWRATSELCFAAYK